MKKFLESKSDFKINVYKLMTGTIAAQVIPLILSPVLTRLYTPKDFGLWDIYMSITGFIGIVATGRYALAIVLPKEKKDAMSLFSLSIFLSVLMSFISFIIIFFFRSSIIDLYNEPELGYWLYFIPLSIFFIGVLQAYEYWFTREKKFMTISVGKILESTSSGISRIAIVIKQLFQGGLILGNLIGQGVVFFLFVIKDLKHFYSIGKDKFSDIIRNAKTYSDFLKINSLHALIDSLQLMLVTYMIVYYFGTEENGFYSFASRILRVPVGFIGVAIAQVFYQKASERYAESGNIYPLVRKLVLSTLKIGLPIFITIFFFGDFIFEFIFGKAFATAGTYGSIMSPWIFLGFITSPISGVAIIMNKQKPFFFLGLLRGLAAVGAIYIGNYMFHDIKSTLQVLTIVMIVVYLYIVYWIIVTAKKKN